MASFVMYQPNTLSDNFGMDSENNYQCFTSGVRELSRDDFPSKENVSRRMNIAWNPEALEELAAEREYMRNQPPNIPPGFHALDTSFVVYSNGLLINQDGDVVSLSDCGISQQELDADFVHYNSMCDIAERDECVLSLKLPSDIESQEQIDLGYITSSNAYTHAPPPLQSSELWRVIDYTPSSDDYTPENLQYHFDFECTNE